MGRKAQAKGTSPDVQTPPVSGELAVVKQEELFSPDEFPSRPDLVAMVKAKSFIHNASLLSTDEELCRGVCRDVLLRLTDRQIAKKWRISRNSIVGIMQVMRERGELEPLKQAISDELGEIIMIGLGNYKDALLANLVAPGSIPIPMKLLIESKAQLDGNVIPGTSLPAPELTAADIEREILEMKRAVVIDVRTPDKQSEEPAPKLQ